MAINARIRYDIEATTTGAANVERLANEFDKLDGAVDPQLAARAREVSTELRNLGDQRKAIDTFFELKTKTESARNSLTQAQTAAQAFARELAQSDAPTRAQAGKLEKLRDAVNSANTEFQEQTKKLAGARASLEQYGLSVTGLGTRSSEVNKEIGGLVAEVDKLSNTAKGAGGFGTLIRDTDTARARMEAAAQAADSFRTSISQSGPPTAAQAAQLRTLQAAAEKARVDFDTLQTSVVDQAGALRRAGVNTEALTVQARALGNAERATAADVRAASAAYTQQGQAANAAAEQQTRSASTVREGLQGIAGQLRGLQTLAGAALGGQLLAGTLGDVARTADAYSNLRARISLVTGEGAALQQTFQGVFDVAQRTNSRLESTGELFTRIATAGKAIGLSTQGALALTETVNQAIQVSGTSAEASDAAITQLIQGLQSGVLRGEEFNSVMEQAPRLAKALADGLGVTTGELRKQAEAGRLTSEVVIGALQGQADTVAREFSKLPPTVGRAITNLSTSWTQYIGEVDQANGISSAAASIINALAGNLSTLGNVLLGAGKAAAAYKAIQLAQTFLANAQATQAATVAAEREALAKSAATVATTANTAATTANTAAKVANAGAATAAAGAADAAAAGVGRFGALLGALKPFALLAILTNIKDIGTALGEGIAKWAGYGQVIDDAERSMRADAAAAQEAARQTAALAQAKQLAADKALGLNAASQLLVGEFEGVRLKGAAVADALDKVTKSLQLGDTTGIANAAAALDALAVRGQITGDQVRTALAAGLSGADLAIFETQARAAFDGSEQGARRLAAALDSVTIEALRRAGTSVQELQTGFSNTTNSALNDVDTLARSLTQLGARGGEAGRALSGSLNRALDAANTERAVQAVIDRWEQLGRQGLVTGQQLSAGLEQARAKLDEIKPGVSSLDEALRTFGLKTQAQMQQTADTFRSAWEQIRNSTQVGLQDKIRAFEQYRDAATAANKGVVPSEIAVQEEMLRMQRIAAETGSSMRDLGNSGVSGMDRITSSAERARKAVEDVKTASLTGDTREQRLQGQNAVDAGGFFAVKDKLERNTLTAEDAKLVEALADAVRQNQQLNASVGPGGISFEGLRSFEEQANVARRAQEQLAAIKARENSAKQQQNNGRIDTPTATPQSTSHNVTITLPGGQTTTINAASASDASALVSMLQQLQAAAARS
jgi:tape measure domain-containing protein